MALIGKIREKSWLLVIVIGIAMLAFVIGDMNPFSNNAQVDVYGIGTVDGEKVDENQYNTYANNARNNILQSKFQRNPDEQPRLTKQDQESATQQAWQTAVLSMLLDKEYKKIGLEVDEFELENVLYAENGFNPSSMSQQFVDSVTGEFAPDQLRNAINNLIESNDPQAIAQYHDVLDFVRRERVEQKYNALLNIGIHATSLEGKKEYEAKKTVKNISYVYQRFTEVPNDAIVEPTEAEIKKYFDAHKSDEKYKQKANTKISYFEVPILPSADDTLKSIDFLNKLKPRFENSKTIREDSILVMRFSEVKMFSSDSSAIVKPEGSMTQGATYPLSIANEVANAEKGDVIGPYLSMNGATLSKVIGFGTEKTATVRHILLNARGPIEVESTQKKADSIVRVIRSKNNFEEMVNEFSDDPGSKSTGGKYEDFAQGTMVPEFNDFSFNKPIGTLGTVKTDYGIHIVEVLARKSTEYPKFASIVKRIEVTKSTSDQINSIASNYIYELDDWFTDKNIDQKVEILDSFANNNGYNIQKLTIFHENPTANGFSETAEGKLLRLVFDENAKPGNLSSSPIQDKNRFIVAFISEIVKEGEPKLENIKKEIIAELQKEKQAQYLIDKMLGHGSLEDLSSSIGAKIETEGITFSATNIAVGSEPVIIGAAFSGLKDGETSIPIKGKNGVFVLRIDETSYGEEATDYSAEINDIKRQRSTSFQNQYQNALIKSADIIDNRKLRSYGIK